MLKALPSTVIAGFMVWMELNSLPRSCLATPALIQICASYFFQNPEHSRSFFGSEILRETLILSWESKFLSFRHRSFRVSEFKTENLQNAKTMNAIAGFFKFLLLIPLIFILMGLYFMVSTAYSTGLKNSDKTLHKTKTQVNQLRAENDQLTTLLTEKEQIIQGILTEVEQYKEELRLREENLHRASLRIEGLEEEVLGEQNRYAALEEKHYTLATRHENVLFEKDSMKLVTVSLEAKMSQVMNENARMKDLADESYRNKVLAKRRGYLLGILGLLIVLMGALVWRIYKKPPNRRADADEMNNQKGPFAQPQINPTNQQPKYNKAA